VVLEGAPLLKAHFPRAYLDVNREPYELDPKMFAGRLPGYANIRSVRVAGGLGTVPRVVSESDEIYAAPLTVEAALHRIETLYRPYHAALRRLLAETHVAFGHAVLIDCHSMPSAVRGDPRQRADFAVGDRYGGSCSPAVTDLVVGALSSFGYRIGLNKPYAGGFITEHYGRPAKGLHAVQIEVNRGLYMDETALTPTAGFEQVRRDMQRLAAGLIDLPAALLGTPAPAVAAE
jgi:N-formylglutamate amidohydrolase